MSIVVLFLFVFLSITVVYAVDGAAGIRVDVIRRASPSFPAFREAPAFRNGEECSWGSPLTSRVDIAMTLDANYLRGTMAAVLSILQHTACPESVGFHFLAARAPDPDIVAAIRAAFPYLSFRVYRFDPAPVRRRISPSVRHALDQPLNYARIYLPHLLPPDVARVIYLDSDVVVVDDVRHLWQVA